MGLRLRCLRPVFCQRSQVPLVFGLLIWEASPQEAFEQTLAEDALNVFFFVATIFHNISR